MDMGIVNAGQLTVYDDIDAKLKEYIEDVIFDRKNDSTERLIEIAQEHKGKKKRIKADLSWRKASIEERLSYSLKEGIIDYKGVMNSLVNLIKRNNGDVLLNFEVNKITEHHNKIQIEGNNDYEFDKLIACGGLWSDKLYSKSTLKKSPLKIIPFRGEYLKFKEEFNDIINHYNEFNKEIIWHSCTKTLGRRSSTN